MEPYPALRLCVFRFLLTAVDPIRLPPYAGSALRGGFGRAFRQIACFQRGRGEDGCAGCMAYHSCPYGYIFETRLPPDAEVLRSQTEVPHPFVLEPPLEPPPVYEPGGLVEFRAVLVGRAIAYLPYFVLAFERLGEWGVGRGRGRYRLEEVRAEHPITGCACTVYRDGMVSSFSSEVTVSYGELAESCRGCSPARVEVRYLTPTRLVSGERLVAQPEFAVLVRAGLRRLSALSYFHGGRRWDADYRGIVAEAEGVRLVESELRWLDWERYSSRQDARMKLGGVVGRAVYEGAVGRFLPMLMAMGIVHVGKACSFGNGKVDVRWCS